VSTNVTLTGSATCQTQNPSYEFFVRDPGSGNWFTAGWSTSATFTWPVFSNVPAGSVYDVEVWVRDSGSTSVETVAYGTLGVGCSVATTTSAPGAAEVGGTITLSSTSAGCGTPQYQVWYQPPGGSFTVLAPYSTSSTFQWDTTGLAPGTYSLKVWVEGVGGDPSQFQAQDTFTLDLGGACTSVTSTIDTTTPSVGDAVTLTATATCGAPAMFQYWMTPPGGAPTMVQDWTPVSSYTLDTTGFATGTYQLQARVRAAGSTATVEAQDAGETFTLSDACTGTWTISSTNPSPGTVGELLSLTATGPSCANPQYYAWFMAPPSGVWQQIAPYSTSNTVQVSTTGFAPGTYNFQVWTRDQHAKALYTNWAQFSTSLVDSACTGGAITSSPPGVALLGTVVTLSGASSTCQHPTYEFWMLPPSGGWSQVQSFGTSSTYKWSTFGLPPGTYYFEVWARDVASTAPYDTYSALSYTLQ
jgi:hypothetical protein